MKDAMSESSKLSYQFRTLVTELAKAEKGSYAWEARLAILKRDFPELTEQLRLSEVHLNSVSNGFNNIA
jgi:hypothetical protein